MKIFRAVQTVLAIAFLTISATSLANAQATRTWVSGVGDDANPCSRTAPCKTFAGAISKTAAGGEINCLDPGGFGTVTITKSITIDCRGTIGGILSAATNGIIVNAGVNDVVTLRHLDIQGANTGVHGIRFLAGNTLEIHNVTIANVTNHGIDVSVTGTSQLIVVDSSISRCGQSGISVLASGAGTITGLIHGTKLLKNTNGLNAQNSSRMMVRDSAVFSNTFGFLQSGLTGGGSTVTVVGNTVTSNGTAVQSIAGGTMAAIGNAFSGNNLVFNPNGGAILTGNDNAQALNVSNGVANGGTLPKM